MAKKRKGKCYPGEVDFLEEVEQFDKVAQKVSAVPIDDLIDDTGLTVKQLKERYSTFVVDGVTYCSFVS